MRSARARAVILNEKIGVTTLKGTRIGRERYLQRSQQTGGVGGAIPPRIVTAAAAESSVRRTQDYRFSPKPPLLHARRTVYNNIIYERYLLYRTVTIRRAVMSSLTLPPSGPVVLIARPPSPHIIIIIAIPRRIVTGNNCINITFFFFFYFFSFLQT